MVALTFRIVRRTPNGDLAEGAESLFGPGEAVKGVVEQIVAIEEGTARGYPSIAFVIKTENGKYVFAETTYTLFKTIANGLRAASLQRGGDDVMPLCPKHGEPSVKREDETYEFSCGCYVRGFKP